MRFEGLGADRFFLSLVPLSYQLTPQTYLLTGKRSIYIRTFAKHPVSCYHNREKEITYRRFRICCSIERKKNTVCP